MDSIFAIISSIFGLLPIAQREWKDYLVWPVLKIFWEPWSGKKSHWWHWRLYFGVIVPSFTIEKDPVAGERALWTFAPSNLWRTNFAWRKVVIIEPEDYVGRYQVGFIAQEGSVYKQELCALILAGRSAGLTGAYDNTFFGVSYPEGKPIKLKRVDIVDKSQLPLGVTLF